MSQFIIKIKVPKSPSAIGQTFTLFPKLPPEIPIRIWSLAVVPRIVTLKPCNKVPAVFHANAESRRESRYVFQSSMLTFSMGLSMDPEPDILLLDKSRFCWWAEYHYNAVHTLQCSGARKMIREVRRLALSAKEVIIDPETFSVDFVGALG
jgi:hypothetical protein